MRLLPDVDGPILMATALSSKRRPAALVEIVAATDLIQGAIPFVDKLGEAIRRLSALGLIGMVEDGFTLTPAAHEIMEAQPKRADMEQRLAAVKGRLAAYAPKEECAPIVLNGEQLRDAILAHKASGKASGRNLLMPKPKADRHFKVEGRWRRAPAKGGGKS
jgi:hypothetical protein